ncbi:MAG: serine hydrolase [Bacteroidales bacterium]|nr:serine hydrolase [Bacteroidales bacterium]
MIYPAMIVLLALGFAACNSSETFPFSGDLKVGEPVKGTLAVDTPDTFCLELAANTHLYGFADQLTVDVVVTLLDSVGAPVGMVDGPARGPEYFTFEVKKAGSYFLEVKPFEKESGDYSMELVRVEAIATDAGKRADQLFIPYSGPDKPGAVVGVIQDGKVLFSRACGMADLTFSIPYKVFTPSNIGSLSKQFTAMAILLLEKDGKLSLEDDVRKHLPELPDLGQKVSLRNMLNHTNGFREVYNLMPMTGWKGEDVLLRGEVLEILKQQKELQADPGTEFNYNNSAFILLATIVERISGQSFPEFMEERVFAPLGIGVEEVRGLLAYTHGGADIAHRAFLFYFPGLKGGAVAMSNNALFDAAHVAYEMAALFFGEEMEQAEKAKESPGEEGEETQAAEEGAENALAEEGAENALAEEGAEKVEVP